MKAKLTDLSIQKLPEGLYFDEKVPAFGLRVGKLRKTWLVVKGRTRTQVRLGHYPAISLQEARKKALVTLGSPLKNVSMGFLEAKNAFLNLDRWRPHSKRVLVSNLRYFQWKRTLDKITHEDVASVLEAIPSPSARAHALKDIRTFFNWCVPRYIPSSPCQGMKMDAQPSRDRVLSNDELKAIWNACEGTFGTIVKLLILTGQRKSEIGTLQWERITDTTISIPAAIAKNGREHTFPLGEYAKSLLPPKGTGYLFRSAKDPSARYNGYAFHLKQLQKNSGTSGWTLHDLRRTFATNLAALGTPIHVTEKLLNHVSGSHGGIVGVYQRFQYLDEQREAIAAYEAHIKRITA